MRQHLIDIDPVQNLTDKRSNANNFTNKKINFENKSTENIKKGNDNKN